MSRKSAAPRLTLTLDGQEIVAERFVKAVASFAALVADVSESVTGERAAFRWIVSVESGSAIVHFRPVPHRADAAAVPLSIKAVNDGLEMLEKRAERPRFWSDNALRKAKEVADVLDPERGALDRVRVSADHKARSITRKLVAHVEELIGSEYKSLGTIEGRLRTVTEAGGMHFVVQDPITHNGVRCYFDEEHLDECIKAFRRRVAVYGEIRYRKDGVPISIAVRELRLLREASDLPKAKDVRGILAT